MGVGLPSMRLHPLGYLLEAGDAFGPARIHAYHVDGARVQDALIAFQVPLLLAVRHPGCRLGAQGLVSIGVPRAERLLDPGDPILLHGARPLHRRRDIPLDGPAEVDHDRQSRTDRLPDRLHEGDVTVVLVTQPGVAALAEADLRPL